MFRYRKKNYPISCIVLLSGLQIGGRQSSNSRSGRTSKREPADHPARGATDSYGDGTDGGIMSPEENLQDLELQVNNVQYSRSHFPSCNKCLGLKKFEKKIKGNFSLREKRHKMDN